MREMPRPKGDTAYRVIAACILLAAFLLAPLCMGDVVAVEPSPAVQTPAVPTPAVQTFFESDLGQVILAAIGTVASAAFAAFTASGWYRAHTNLVSRKIMDIIAAAVASTYTQHVRAMKRMSPDGKLTNEQKGSVENVAIDIARNAARREGLIDQPVFQDTERLRGEIVQAVAVAKAVAGATRDMARPTTKGGV